MCNMSRPVMTEAEVENNVAGDHSSPFTVRKVNDDTFVIREDDSEWEFPLIYLKRSPQTGVILLSDTGCDLPHKRHDNDTYLHLRDWIEGCPLQINNNSPLNPNGFMSYVVITTHCHFDHVGGITQFVDHGETEIIAAAAGRHFVESDLATHGLFKELNIPTPSYSVTTWAESFQRLQLPTQLIDANVSKKLHGFDITIIHTPGHSPDELAWYDHDETHLYVGDSFYETGKDKVPIVWPKEGNMIEWVFSMLKLQRFIGSENERLSSLSNIASVKAGRVLVSCGHESVSVDGEDIMARLMTMWWRTVRGEVPVVRTSTFREETVDTWWEEDSAFTFQGPRRLMDDVRRFFGDSIITSLASWRGDTTQRSS